MRPPSRGQKGGSGRNAHRAPSPVGKRWRTRRLRKQGKRPPRRPRGRATCVRSDGLGGQRERSVGQERTCWEEKRGDGRRGRWLGGRVEAGQDGVDGGGGPEEPTGLDSGRCGGVPRRPTRTRTRTQVSADAARPGRSTRTRQGPADTSAGAESAAASTNSPQQEHARHAPASRATLPPSPHAICGKTLASHTDSWQVRRRCCPPAGRGAVLSGTGRTAREPSILSRAAETDVT